MVIIAITLTLVVFLPAHDLRLLALVFAAPALFWASRELLRRRAGLRLESDSLVLRHPASLRPLRVPYRQVGGVLAWPRADTLGIVYYLPRPPFEGEEDPRPPRIRTTITAPVEKAGAALAGLRDRSEAAHGPNADRNMPLLAEAEVGKRLRGRRFRRRMLAVVAFLAMPLLTILASRLLFILINAVRYVLPK